MRRLGLSLMLLSAFPAAAGAYEQKWKGFVFARTGGRAPVVVKLDAVDVPAQPVQCRDAFGPISVMSPAHIELTGAFRCKGTRQRCEQKVRGTVLRVRVFPPASYPPITDGGCSPSYGLLLDGGVQFGTDALCYIWGNPSDSTLPRGTTVDGRFTCYGCSGISAAGQRFDCGGIGYVPGPSDLDAPSGRLMLHRVK